MYASSHIYVCSYSMVINDQKDKTGTGNLYSSVLAQIMILRHSQKYLQLSHESCCKSWHVQHLLGTILQKQNCNDHSSENSKEQVQK